MTPKSMKKLKEEQYERVDNKLRCRTCLRMFPLKSSYAVLKAHYETHLEPVKVVPEPPKNEILRSLLEKESTIPIPGGAGMSSGGMGAGMSGSMQAVPGTSVGSMPGPAGSQGMVQSQMQQHPQEQRKHQLQQQMQQLRGAGSVSHPPRVMRPMLPSNPGLRHLLQQQPQPPRGPSRPHM